MSNVMSGLQDELRKKFIGQFEEEFRSLKKPNILIAGRTGVGKSTLINAIFDPETKALAGSGRPITKNYELFASEELLINIYDSPGWEGGSENETKFLNETKEFITEHQIKEVVDHIHVIWYVIDAPNARFTDFDATLAKKAFENISVLFILSKCDIASPESIEKIKQAIEQSKIPNNVGIVEVSAEPFITRGKPICSPFGLEKVVQETVNRLPDLVQRAFIAAQQVNLREKDKQAKKIILMTVVTVFGSGFIPIPFADTLAMAAIQTTMIAQLSIMYGFKRQEDFMVIGVSGLYVNFSSSYLTYSLVSAIKFIPALSTVGGFLNATMGSTITAAIGFTFRALFHVVLERTIKGEQFEITKEWVDEFIKQRMNETFKQIKLVKELKEYEDLY